MIQDIDPVDKYGRWHGYQVWYRSDFNVHLRSNYTNGNPNGYYEWYRYIDRKIGIITFHIL